LDPVLGTPPGAWNQGHRRPLLQLDRTSREAADPEFGSLDVLEYGHIAPRLLRRPPDPFEPATMGGVVAMGEIESGHVHARLHQATSRFVGLDGGPQSGHDLGSPHA